MLKIRSILLAQVLVLNALPALSDQARVEQGASAAVTLDQKELAAQEVARREQLLRQMTELRKVSESQLTHIKETQVALDAAIQKCKEECTSEEIYSAVAVLRKYSRNSAASIVVLNAIRLVVAEGLQYYKTSERALKSFSRPWQTITGKAMLLSGAIYGATALVDGYLNEKDSMNKTDIENLKNELVKYEKLVEQTYNSIKTITDSLALSIKIRTQLNSTVTNTVGYE